MTRTTSRNAVSVSGDHGKSHSTIAVTALAAVPGAIGA
jgi:hypothetical protein